MVSESWAGLHLASDLVASFAGSHRNPGLPEELRSKMSAGQLPPMTLAQNRNALLSTTATEFSFVILSFLTGILSARWLGPEGRGLFTIVILWPTVIAGLGNAGVAEALVYYQAGGQRSGSELAGAAFALAGLQSLLLFSAGWLIIPILTAGHAEEVMLLSRQFLIFIPSNLFGIYALALLRGQMRIHRFNLIRGSLNLVYLLGISALWWMHSLEVWTMALTLFAANMAIAIWAWGSLVKKSGFYICGDFQVYRQLLEYGIKDHFGKVSLIFNARLDQMLMAVFLSPMQLGWYSVGASVATLTTTGSEILEKLLFPRVAGAKSEVQQKQLISVFSRQNMTTTFCLVAVMLLVTPFLLPLVYSRAYLPSVVPAELLILGGIFLSLNQNWEAGMRGLGRPALASQAEFIGLVVTGLGLAFLLPRFGILGAAIASTISYFATSLYLYFHYALHWHFNFRELLTPIPLSDLCAELFAREAVVKP